MMRRAETPAAWQLTFAGRQLSLARPRVRSRQEGALPSVRAFRPTDPLTTCCIR
jgi:hypothetical protein